MELTLLLAILKIGSQNMVLTTLSTMVFNKLVLALAMLLTWWYWNVNNTLYLLLNPHGIGYDTSNEIGFVTDNRIGLSTVYVTDNRIGHGTENGTDHCMYQIIDYVTYYVTFMVWTIVSTIILAMVVTIWKCLKYKLYNIFYNMAVLWY